MSRRVSGKKPPLAVEYRLTELGQNLRPPIEAICAWAERNGWHDTPTEAVS